MKKRVKIDSALLSLLIIITGFFVLFPQFYLRSILVDDLMDFVGLFLVLCGNYLRMSARGHKAAHSKKGKGLVTTGPYTLTRNPMYLGSFTMGAGFILIVWPWWILPVFAGLFVMRFRIQVVKEEEYMKKEFGPTYEQYLEKVPAIFPRLDSLPRIRFQEVFPFEEAWATKEKGGLLGWPALAVLLELFQEKIVFGSTDPRAVVILFLSSGLIFALLLWGAYRNKDAGNSK